MRKAADRFEVSEFQGFEVSILGTSFLETLETLQL
jgi:hypothetical protein